MRTASALYTPNKPGVHLVKRGEEGVSVTCASAPAGSSDAMNVVFDGEGEGEVDDDLCKECGFYDARRG